MFGASSELASVMEFGFISATEIQWLQKFSVGCTENLSIVALFSPCSRSRATAMDFLIREIAIRKWTQAVEAMWASVRLLERRNWFQIRPVQTQHVVICIRITNYIYSDQSNLIANNTNSPCNRSTSFHYTKLHYCPSLLENLRSR